LVLCFGAAAFGSQFAPGSWYAGLRKPDWTPPSWLFGPVWTALYTMMAVSAWRIQRRGRKVPGLAGPARLALIAFLVQLVLNALWSWIFFGLRQPGLALIEIVALGLAIAACIRLFHPIDRPAALLLLPYLAWVTFASVLNGALWWMNR
jgi:tryptophan-rich sensory protein